MSMDIDQEFEAAVTKVLEEESGGDPAGGLTDNPKDPGGLTKWGISKRAFPGVDIKNLSRDDAKALYKSHYWDPLGSYHLTGVFQRVAFECAINQGVSKARALLDVSKGQLDWFMADRALAYISLPTFSTFGKGWMRRLFKELL